MFSSKSKARKLEAKIDALMDEYQDDPHEALVFQIIKLLEKSRRLSEAFKWAKHAREGYATSGKAVTVYRRLKQKKTLNSLRQAKAKVKADPSAKNWVRLSELLRISGKPKKSLQVALRTDAAFPDNWLVQLALGKLHFDLFSRSKSENDGWNAVEHLDVSRCLKPENYSTLILLIITLTRLHSYENAMVIVEEVLRYAPDDKRALSLKVRVQKALQKLSETSGAQQHLTSTAGEGDGAREEATGDCEGSIKRVMNIPSIVGAYSFDKNGRLVDSMVRGSDVFDFAVPAEVFESMAAACRLNTQRIGLGDFHSCSVSGEGWNVDYHTASGVPILAFFQGDFSGEEAEEQLNSALCAGETVA